MSKRVKWLVITLVGVAILTMGIGVTEQFCYVRYNSNIIIDKCQG